MLNFGPYSKTLIAVVTGVIGWVTLVVNSAPTDITSWEWIMGVTVLATALGVFGVSNAPSSTSNPA